MKGFVCRFRFPTQGTERRTFCKTVRKAAGHVIFLSHSLPSHSVSLSPTRSLPLWIRIALTCQYCNTGTLPNTEHSVVLALCFTRFSVHCVPPVVVWRAGTLFLYFSVVFFSYCVIIVPVSVLTFVFLTKLFSIISPID